jgi:hypothetical protein
MGFPATDCERINRPFRSDTIGLSVTIDCNGDSGLIWPVLRGAKIRDNRLRSDKNVIAIGFCRFLRLALDPETAKLRQDESTGQGRFEDGFAGRVGEGHPMVCIRNGRTWPVQPRRLHPRRLPQLGLLALRECRRDRRDPDRLECPRPCATDRHLGRRRWHQGRMGGEPKP